MRAHIGEAKVGDWIRIGFKGSRVKVHEKVEQITPSGRIRTSTYEFNADGTVRTAHNMVVADKDVIHAQLATDKDLEDLAKSRFRQIILNMATDKSDRWTADQMWTIIGHMMPRGSEFSCYDPRAGGYITTEVHEPNTDQEPKRWVQSP